MAYFEDDLLPLSALQHLIFCERQCALIHIEQVWAENRLTAEGRILHEKTEDHTSESRRDIRLSYGVSLRSLRLGLTGKADAVEFHKAGEAWIPFPVEYKRGKPKPDDCDKVQLCAQALCLEEMLNVNVPAGALFYGSPRRRLDVQFDDGLRGMTTETSGRLHELVRSGKTPTARYDKKCDSCSLFNLCMPKVTGKRSASRYLTEAMQET